MRPTTAIVCFILSAFLPAASPAKNWHVQLGGSWCILNWDNENYYWEEATANAGKVTIGYSYKRLRFETQYAKCSFDASGTAYEYDVDQDELLGFFGYCFLTNPNVVLGLTSGYTRNLIEADSWSYGARDYQVEEVHQFLGLRVVASHVLGESGAVFSGGVAYSPWGNWTSERDGVDPMGEPYVTNVEDTSPLRYGGELGIAYRLTKMSALVQTSWGFLNRRIEYDYPGTSFSQKHDESLQIFELGLTYQF